MQAAAERTRQVEIFADPTTSSQLPVPFGKGVMVRSLSLIDALGLPTRLAGLTVSSHPLRLKRCCCKAPGTAMRTRAAGYRERASAGHTPDELAAGSAAARTGGELRARKAGSHMEWRAQACVPWQQACMRLLA